MLADAPLVGEVACGSSRCCCCPRVHHAEHGRLTRLEHVAVPIEPPRLLVDGHAVARRRDHDAQRLCVVEWYDPDEKVTDE